MFRLLGVIWNNICMKEQPCVTLIQPVFENYIILCLASLLGPFHCLVPLSCPIVFTQWAFPELFPSLDKMAIDFLNLMP